MTRLLSDRYWINELCGVSDFSANATKMSKSQLYPSQTAQRRTIFIWLEQCCNPWSAPAGDRTNRRNHSAIKTMTFNPVSTGQLTCLHYHPAQQWDGAEQPTASSHLQLQHNQREHCSDAWQAAWPSPRTDHLQHKVLSSSVRLSSLQHHLLLTRICAAKEIWSADHQALSTDSLRQVANYSWDVRIEGMSPLEEKLGACWAFRQQESWEQSNPGSYL